MGVGGLDGQRAFMQKWLEPPVQNKASFQDYGLMRTGVVEHMLPLGTVPKPAHVRKLAEKATAPLAESASSPTSTAEPPDTLTEEEDGAEDADDARPAAVDNVESICPKIPDVEKAESTERSDSGSRQNKPNQGEEKRKSDYSIPCHLKEQENQAEKEVDRVESDGDSFGTRSLRSTKARRRRTTQEPSQLSPGGQVKKAPTPASAQSASSHLLLRKATQNPHPARKIILKRPQSHSPSPSPFIHSAHNVHSASTSTPTLILKPPAATSSSLAVSSLPHHSHCQHPSPITFTSPATPSPTFLPTESPTSTILRPSSPLDETASHLTYPLDEVKLTRSLDSMSCKKNDKGKTPISTIASSRPPRAAHTAPQEALTDVNDAHDIFGSNSRSRPNNHLSTSSGSISPVRDAKRKLHNIEAEEDDSGTSDWDMQDVDPTLYENWDIQTMTKKQLFWLVSRVVKICEEKGRFPTSYAIQEIWKNRHAPSHEENIPLFRLLGRQDGPQTQEEVEKFQKFVDIVLEHKKKAAREGIEFPEDYDKAATPAIRSPWMDSLAEELRDLMVSLGPSGRFPRLQPTSRSSIDHDEMKEYGRDDDTREENTPLSKKQKQSHDRQTISPSQQQYGQEPQSDSRNSCTPFSFSTNMAQTLKGNSAKSSRTTRSKTRLEEGDTGDLPSLRPGLDMPFISISLSNSNESGAKGNQIGTKREINSPSKKTRSPYKKIQNQRREILDSNNDASDSELSELPSDVEEQLHEEFGDQWGTTPNTDGPHGPIRSHSRSLTTKHATSSIPVSSGISTPSSGTPQPLSSPVSHPSIAIGSQQTKIQNHQTSRTAALAKQKSSKAAVAAAKKAAAAAQKQRQKELRAQKKAHEFAVPSGVEDEPGYAQQRRENKENTMTLTTRVILGESAAREEPYNLAGFSSVALFDGTHALAPSASRGTKRTRDEVEETYGSMSPVEHPFKRLSKSVAPSRAATPVSTTGGTAKTRAIRLTGPRFKTSPVKNRNGGPVAGFPSKRFIERGSPQAHANDDKILWDNDDNCTACGGAGDLLCCDGCPSAIHPGCLDPPLESIAELGDSDWFCEPCKQHRSQVIEKEKPKKGSVRKLSFLSRVQHRSSGIFGSLIRQLDTQNTKSVILPEDIRHAFAGVQTGPDGEYEEIPPKPATRNRTGYVEEPGLHHSRDRNNNVRICHGCDQSIITDSGKAVREMVTCLACGLHWHLECCDPPIVKGPNTTAWRMWKCPAHVDDVLANHPMLLGPAHKRREPKNPRIITPAYTRGVSNHGFIEVDHDSEDDDGNPIYNFTKHDDYTARYKLSSTAIKLDFLSRVRANETKKQLNGTTATASATLPSIEKDFKRSLDQTSLLSSTSADQDAILSLLLMSRQSKPLSVSSIPQRTSNVSSPSVVEIVMSLIDSDLILAMQRHLSGNNASLDDKHKIQAFVEEIRSLQLPPVDSTAPEIQATTVSKPVSLKVNGDLNPADMGMLEDVESS